MGDAIELPAVVSHPAGVPSMLLFRQKKLWWGLLAIGWVLSLGCPRSIEGARVPEHSRNETQKGVGLGLFASRPDYNYEHLIDEIVRHGATDLLVVVPWYQADRSSHDIHPRRGFSPSTQNVLRTLRQAKSKGLRVSLLPIVRLAEREPNEWRGRIAPKAGVDAWFRAYAVFLNEMAQAAQAAGIARFGVGSELLSLERHETAWRKLIDDVRTRFQGRLYYSANWDHFEPIGFWDALDEVGITAYFELASSLDRPDAAALRRAWRKPQLELARLKSRLNKPIVLTEVGYPSRASAARYPWDETSKSPVDVQLQADLYRAFCNAFIDSNLLAGFYFWNWFGFGGTDDGEYTPRGKPAAQVMRSCLEDTRW